MKNGHLSSLENMKRCREQLKSITFQTMRLPEWLDPNISVHRPNKGLINKYNDLLKRRAGATYIHIYIYIYIYIYIINIYYIYIYVCVCEYL